jgi:hypothetical protein
MHELTPEQKAYVDLIQNRPERILRNQICEGLQRITNAVVAIGKSEGRSEIDALGILVPWLTGVLIDARSREHIAEMVACGVEDWGAT